MFFGVPGRCTVTLAGRRAIWAERQAFFPFEFSRPFPLYDLTISGSLFRTSGLRVTFDLRFDKPLLWLVCSRFGCMLKTHLSACVAYTNNLLRHIIHADRISLFYLTDPWLAMVAYPLQHSDAPRSISSRSCPSQRDQISTAFWLQTAKRSQAICDAERHWPSSKQSNDHVDHSLFATIPSKSTRSDPITPISISTTFAINSPALLLHFRGPLCKMSE